MGKLQFFSSDNNFTHIFKILVRTLSQKPNICRCYPLIFVGADIAVGRVSNLMSRVLPVLFPGGAHSFTSCQLALLQ